MKYAVRYSTPGEEREPRRTRFVTLRMAKRKEKALKAHGHVTKLIPRSSLVENNKVLRVARRRTNISNHWKFITAKDGSMRCIKNGSVLSVQKLP